MSASVPAVPSHGAAQAHAHPPTNTGISNGLIGVMLFLCSEMALFGSLIFAYLYVRRAAPVWPPPGQEHFNVFLALGNTIVLLSSGVTMHFSFQALRRNSMRTMVILLVITIVLGILFLSGQATEYATVHGVSWTSQIYGATFFTLTGLHGIHVSGGVIFLLIILFRTLRGDFENGKSLMVPHAATLYWHFVDAVWVVLFALFYLSIPA